MQINRNEQSDLSAFIADLKKLGLEVEVKERHLVFMLPNKNGNLTFIVGLQVDLYNFYPASNTIHNGYGKAFAVEKTDKEFKTVMLFSKMGNIEICNDPVYYED